MNHHSAPQGVASSPTDNLVRRFPRIFYSVQLFLQAFALKMKFYLKLLINEYLATKMLKTLYCCLCDCDRKDVDARNITLVFFVE